MTHDSSNQIEYLSVWPPPIPSGSSSNEETLEISLEHEKSIKNSQKHREIRDLIRKYKCNENEDYGNDRITTAETLLASWWRHRIRSNKKCRLSHELSELENSISKITCPRAKLNAIKRHPSAKDFLHGEALKLKNQSDLSPKQRFLLSTIQFNLAFVEDLDKLGMYKNTTLLSYLADAEVNLSKCISKTLSCNYEDLERLSHTEYLSKNSEFDEFQKEVLTFSIKLGLQIHVEESLNHLNSETSTTYCDKERQEKFNSLPMIKYNSIFPTLSSSEHTNVNRIDAKDLNVKTFLEEYCKKGRPLVITGIKESEVVSHPWTLDHISEIAGSQTVCLKKPNKESIKWAKLEPSVTMSITEFISNVKSGASESNYLFDWSLPLFCPKLNSEITIPKYFQHDYLKKTSNDALYRQSWPSLFISAKGSLSELHVDAFASNFWMYLFQGRKRWTFFDPKYTNSLGPKYYESLDPVFELDLSNEILAEKFKDQVIEVVLEKGELLFVPYNSPHRVENLENSMAISGNYVDESNIDCVANHLRRNLLQDPRAGDLLKEFVELGLV